MQKYSAPGLSTPADYGQESHGSDNSAVYSVTNIIKIV